MKLQLEQFEGPLDLLLSLISEKKMEISEVAISEVTDQFITHVEGMDDERPDEVANFLVIATKLLLMKSKALLPLFMPEEEEGPSLEEQLRLYQKFVQASKELNKKWLSDIHMAFRIEPVRPAEGFVPPENVTTDSVHQSMVRLVERLTPLKPLPKIRIEKTVSVKERIKQLRDLLKKRKQFSFSEALEKENKSEIIIGFLALLELVKQRAVVLDQQGVFGDIVVNRT